jgi:hypothetical protein
VINGLCHGIAVATATHTINNVLEVRHVILF